MIVSIRGTHGSGKSTIVKTILNLYKAEGINPDKRGRTEGYTIRLRNGKHLFVVGSYHNACGGCDGIQPYHRILTYIKQATMDHDHVLFEGALVSSSYGSVGLLLNEYAPDAAFAFLDTPLELCLERIKQRRAAKGNFEPLNPTNTSVKHENVHRTKAQMAKLGSKVKIVDIRHTHAVMDVMKLFGVKLSEEPKHAQG